MAAAVLGSPEWARRREILSTFRTKVEVDQVQGRSLVGLAVLSAAGGIPAALGFLPVAVFVPFGGLVVMSMVRYRLSSTTPGREMAWLAILGVAASALYARFETVDTQAVLGAQAVLGPALLVAPFASGLLTGLAGAAGLVSCVFHIARGPAFKDELAPGVDPLLRWLQTGLAAALIAAALAGPSIAMLARGPLDGRMALAVAASTLSLLTAVVAVSYSARWLHRLPEKPALISCAAIVALCLLAQPLV